MRRFPALYLPTTVGLAALRELDQVAWDDLDFAYTGDDRLGTSDCSSSTSRRRCAPSARPTTTSGGPARTRCTRASSIRRRPDAGHAGAWGEEVGERIRESHVAAAVHHAAIAVFEPITTQAFPAIVALATSGTKADLDAVLAANQAMFACDGVRVRALKFVAAIPKSASGRILRRVLVAEDLG